MTSAAVTRLGLKPLAFVTLFLSLTLSCTNSPRQSSTARSTVPATPVSSNVFDAYLLADHPPADGFDFPFGRGDGGGSYVDNATGQQHEGWYVATRFGETYSLGIHPGEDWNGNGGGNTDLGQDVFAVANGRVAFAANCGRLWGNVILIDHVFYENQQRKKIRSLYAHLQTISVSPGDKVRRRQKIATVGQDPEKLFNAHLHLEFRWDESLEPTYWPSSNNKDVSWVNEHYTEPTTFIKSHRKTFVPQAEPLLVLVDQPSYKMRLYQKNALIKEYDVSFGQGSGSKQIQGDNKTPVGMYFVIQKHQGEFDGPYGDYYGGHWVKINYPNKYDASRGLEQRLINASEHANIARSWETRSPTLQNTSLVVVLVFTVGSVNGKTMDRDIFHGDVW